jgi:hypothetical protein
VTMRLQVTHASTSSYLTIVHLKASKTLINCGTTSLKRCQIILECLLELFPWRCWLGSKFGRNSFQSRARNLAGTGMPRNFDLVPVISEVLCVADDYQRSLMLSN